MRVDFLGLVLFLGKLTLCSTPTMLFWIKSTQYHVLHITDADYARPYVLVELNQNNHIATHQSLETTFVPNF
jgi:hypothetical protein